MPNEVKSKQIGFQRGLLLLLLLKMMHECTKRIPRLRITIINNAFNENNSYLVDFVLFRPFAAHQPQKQII